MSVSVGESPAPPQQPTVQDENNTISSLNNSEDSAGISDASKAGAAIGSSLPAELEPSGSTLEGLRVLQCIEWLRDRIMDASLGHDDVEMVSPAAPKLARSELLTAFLPPSSHFVWC